MKLHKRKVWNPAHCLTGIVVTCKKVALSCPLVDLWPEAVFRSEIFGENIPVALSLLFGKIYPTMN
jgi:hypothetical protein